ncbi:MAG: serine/threonine protein kinase [Candidatus Aminicenantales bacterium]
MGISWNDLIQPHVAGKDIRSLWQNQYRRALPLTRAAGIGYVNSDFSLSNVWGTKKGVTVSQGQLPLDHVGKYRIIGILGKGGMGIVYRGLDPDIERDVAVKTIRFDTSPDGPVKEEMLNRVIREAKAAGHLTHPNIITIYDVIRERDLTFIVMQYVDGQSLQALIESGKSFSPQEVLAIVKPVAEALDYAHGNGIVHRDIKPANILIDTVGKPFLADFGVARMEASTMTGPGTTIGTLSYMSPEQVMGKTADGRADIFALGVILFELLTGQKPFPGDNLSTIVYKIVHDEPRPVTEVNPDLPAGYESIIRRALAKQPEDRYQTCRELVRDLEDPDNLSAASKDYELRRGASGEIPGKRRRPVVLAAAVLALAAVAGGFLVLRPRLAGPSQTGAVDSAAPPATAPDDGGPLARLKESFTAKDYEGTVRLAGTILSEDPGNVEARDLGAKAQSEIDVAQAASLFKRGLAGFEAGEYAACVRDMDEVLRLNTTNQAARDYLLKADTTLSRQEIRAMIERRRQAEEREDLQGVLRSVDPGGLAALERSRYSAMFTIYDGIRSEIEDNTIAIDFSDRTHSTAGFYHAIQGISRNGGKPKAILFSQTYWTLEKRGGVWTIIGIQERS